ncbi:MAG: Crp/Fnr family transcriptional regulator [Bacteroidota bacterium]
MQAHRDILRKMIAAFGEVDEEAFEAFALPWTEVKVKRKQIMTRQGETEKYLYLVLNGVQHAWYQHGDREATLVFSYAPSFSGIIDSFFLQQPSRFTLETITASTFLRIHYNDMAALMAQHRSIETWVRISLTRVLADTLGRHIELLTYTAEEKFTALLHRSPHILNLIPHKYLASYIGVDATNFSKLLGRVRL